MKKVFEKQYGDHLRLQGAIVHFLDELCGMLDAYIEDEVIHEADELEDIYQATITFDNGITYDVDIYLQELIWHEEYAWNCTAFEK